MKSEQASELTRVVVERELKFLRELLCAGTYTVDSAAVLRLRIALCEHYLSTVAPKESMVNTPGYPWLPCPICHGVEGCSDTVPERMAAARNAEDVEPAPKESGAVAWRDQPGDVFKSFRAICKLPEGDARKEAFLWFSHGYACMNPPAPWREAVKQLVADMRARNCGAAPGDIQRWAERIESLPAQQGDGNA